MKTDQMYLTTTVPFNARGFNLNFKIFLLFTFCSTTPGNRKER